MRISLDSKFITNTKLNESFTTSKCSNGSHSQHCRCFDRSIVFARWSHCPYVPPSNTWFCGPHDSAPQTAFRMVQPFFKGSCTAVTDTQAEAQAECAIRQDVTSNIAPHLATSPPHSNLGRARRRPSWQTSQIPFDDHHPI